LNLRAEGTPILIKGETSRPLRKIHIGGKGSEYNERWLQQLIHEYPDCIPMDQIEPGLGKLVPICMELGLSSGFVDNLLMTPEGNIVIVETKLWRNPQARREVVAQALDYAASLFRMDYAELEKLILKAEHGKKPAPKSLYEFLGEADTLDEPSFIDAANLNLRNGRIVILVVGDGIRSEVMDLSEGLQAHAGFHFTFALVELAVYNDERDGTLIILPRTLASTVLIERGIVRIDDQRSDVVAPSVTAQKTETRRMRQSITSEQFFEAMSEIDPKLPEKLKTFIEGLSELDVYPEFLGSLNLKWAPPTGKPVNLGYIKKTGEIWTDAAGWFVPEPRLAHVYNEKLAHLFEGTVVEGKNERNAYVMIAGKVPRIGDVADCLGDWKNAMKSFIESIQKHLSEVNDAD
jgi:hypothetical protein